MQNREKLLAIISYVLSQIAPQKLFKGIISKTAVRKFEKIAIISIGKAAKPMAQAVISRLPRKPDYILFADKGHPLPTKEGVKNTEKITRYARDLGEKDLAIVLISGGGSAMLASPVPEISLADKIKITELLLQSGATINEMNIVRKHLSQVKGGNLAALLYPATVWGSVISDVVGNDLSTISSGPITPDKSAFSDAFKILKKYRIAVPKNVKEYLKRGINNKKLETPKPGEKYFKKVFIKILADHNTVLKKACEKAKKLGLKTVVLKSQLIGEARKVAKKFVSKAKKNALLIATGETTVTCRGKGFGGRNQEFVLSGLRYIKPNQTLLSIGTDGIDGICPQLVAGAIADSTILKSAKKQKLRIADFLRNNDSYTFFKKTHGLIKTGKTGTNLGDLMLLLS